MGFEIEDLRKKYDKYKAVHGLPNFDELNENFEIDKIDRDSGCFMRVVRKVIMEKIVNSLNFLDMLLNPVNAPRIYYAYLKGMNVEDKNTIDSLYKKFGLLSIESLSLEIKYDEKKEIDLIKNVFKIWNGAKGDFDKLMKSIKNPNGEIRKEKSYFG